MGCATLRQHGFIWALPGCILWIVVKETLMLFHQSLPKPDTSKAPPAFYRLRNVTRTSALSRSTAYRRISEGRFPPPSTWHQLKSVEPNDSDSLVLFATDFSGIETFSALLRLLTDFLAR